MNVRYKAKLNKAVWRTAIPPLQNDNGAASKFKAQTGGLQLWPWPWVCIVELWVLQITSLRRTFDPNLINIFQRVQEIWSEHEIQGSNSWPFTVTLNLSRHAWVMGSAHRLTKANIWPKFHENLSKGSGDMERTRKNRWPSIVTLTLSLQSLHCWVIGSTHHLTKVNIWPKFNKASLREIFPTDAGQLSDKLKFLAGQNKILQDRRLVCYQITISFGQKSQDICQTNWTFLQDRMKICRFCQTVLQFSQRLLQGSLNGNGAASKFKAQTGDLQLWPWPWVSIAEL